MTEKRLKKLLKIRCGIVSGSHTYKLTDDGSVAVIEKDFGVIELWSWQYFKSVVMNMIIPVNLVEDKKVLVVDYTPFEEVIIITDRGEFYAIFLEFSDEKKVWAMVVLKGEPLLVRTNRLIKKKNNI